MARLLEDDALRLLAEAGIGVPAFAAAATPDAASHAAERIGGAVAIKALVPTGGRGKADAIRFARTPAEACEAAKALLGATVANFPVREVLISAAIEIARELFVSFTFDGTSRQPLLLFSAEGGIDIETLLADAPDRLVRRGISPLHGLRPFEARAAAAEAGLTGRALVRTAEALCVLWRVFRDRDMETLEVNPLALEADGRVIAPTAVAVIDDQAMSRHPALGPMAARAPTNGWRPPTALEREMREIDAADPSSSIRFNEFPDGEIALMVSGGGTGMVALDTLLGLGAKPACTFDTTPGRIEEKTYRATRAVLRQPNVRGLLAGSPFVNFIPVDIKVRGTMRALEEMDIDPGRFPVVLRFDGPNMEEGRRLSEALPGITFFDSTHPMEEAAALIVERVRAL